MDVTGTLIFSGSVFIKFFLLNGSLISSYALKCKNIFSFTKVLIIQCFYYKIGCTALDKLYSRLQFLKLMMEKRFN